MVLRIKMIKNWELLIGELLVVCCKELEDRKPEREEATSVFGLRSSH